MLLACYCDCDRSNGNQFLVIIEKFINIILLSIYLLAYQQLQCDGGKMLESIPLQLSGWRTKLQF